VSIPDWMSGGVWLSTVTNTFSVLGNAPGDSLSLSVFGAPDYLIYWSNGSCDPYNYCDAGAYGPITTGGVAGEVFLRDPNNPFATFSGRATGFYGIHYWNYGSGYMEQESYSYSFRGVWSNEWWTEGELVTLSGFGDWTDGCCWAPTEASFQTYAPEPTTASLALAGLVGVYSWVRHRLSS
jgi:hypothetical protein